MFLDSLQKSTTNKNFQFSETKSFYQQSNDVINQKERVGQIEKKGYWLFVTAFVAAVAISFALLIDKVTVTASDIALSDQGWHANFSTPLKKDALGSDDLYVTDRQWKTDRQQISRLAIQVKLSM